MKPVRRKDRERDLSPTPMDLRIPISLRRSKTIMRTDEETFTDATATINAMMKRRSAFVVRKLAILGYSISRHVATRVSPPAAWEMASVTLPRSANGCLTFTPISAREPWGERTLDARPREP